MLVPPSNAILKSALSTSKQNWITEVNYINKLEHCCANYT